MSFRSMARALRNTNTNICPLLAHSSLFDTPGPAIPRGSLSFCLSICRPPRETAISLTASSAKIVSIRIQMRPRSHHATRHIPLRHSRQFDASDESAKGDDVVIRPLTLSTLSLSAPLPRAESHSNFAFSSREVIKMTKVLSELVASS